MLCLPEAEARGGLLNASAEVAECDGSVGQVASW